MTEKQWLAADSMASVLDWFKKSKRHRPSVRRLQLLANALVAQIANAIPDEIRQRVQQLLDRLVDNVVPYDECLTECRTWTDRIQLEHRSILITAVSVSFRGASYQCGPPETRVRELARQICQLVGSDERAAQLCCLRDIFGNPFRPVAFDPAWRSSDAVALARAMYDSRNFGAMPILADALQDAGCDRADVLTHCRDANQVHVRGCWVCDLVLGKE